MMHITLLTKSVISIMPYIKTTYTAVQYVCYYESSVWSLEYYESRLHTLTSHSHINFLRSYGVMLIPLWWHGCSAVVCLFSILKLLLIGSNVLCSQCLLTYFDDDLTHLQQFPQLVSYSYCHLFMCICISRD